MSIKKSKMKEVLMDDNGHENYDSDYEYRMQDDSEDDLPGSRWGRQDDQDEIEEDEVEDEDSMESDIEGLQDNFELPNEKAWGKKKKAYYSTDYVDPDYASASQKDMANAEIEEEEARNIQKRLAEQLDEADFGLDFIQPIKEDDEKGLEDTEEVVKADLSKLSKRQKQALMQKESPEFMALVNDCKDRLIETRDILAPFLKLVENGTLPDCPAATFIKTKYHLTLNYSVNVSFYLMLKAQKLPVNSHPVIKRLAQYRGLFNQLESEQGNLLKEIEVILKAHRNREPLYNVSDGSKVIQRQTGKVTINTKEKNNPPKHWKVESINTHLPQIPLEDKKSIVEEEESEKEELEDDKDFPENELHSLSANPITESEGKRAITYQMAKNKGLTPHRKKDQRNPRVKHRNKYRKAKIRRKGAVREVRKEITRYAGEISGIKASVKKSIKLK